MVFQRGTSRPQNAKRVGDEAHGGRGRIDVRPAGDVLLEDVVLDGAGQAISGDAALVGHRHVKAEQRRGRGVDGHRRRDRVERQAIEQQVHVLDGRDRHPGAPHFAPRERVVGVVPHLRGQVERHRQAGLPRRQQELVATVGLLGGAEPGVLPHGPRAAPVHAGVDAAREGEGARAAPGRGRHRTAACGRRGSPRRTPRRGECRRRFRPSPASSPNSSSDGPDANRTRTWPLADGDLGNVAAHDERQARSCSESPRRRRRARARAGPAPPASRRAPPGR